MTVPLNRVANEQALKRIQAGFESQRGVPGTIDFKLYGDLTITEDKPLVETPEFDGSYDGDLDPTYGPMTFGGTYNQPLTYEDGPPLLELGVKGGVSPVSDAETTPGYLWGYEPSRFVDDLASLSVEHGFPGMPKLAEMLMFNDFTISADIDDAEAVWKFASNIWVRYNALKDTTASGAATSGSATTFVRTGAGWTVNQFAGAFFELTAGTAGNIGEVIEIASNTSDTLTFRGALPNAVAASDAGVISGTFTAGISDRSRERIKAPGTKLYEADLGETITDHEVEHGFISFSITHNNALNAKRFMNDVDRMSRKLGRNKRIVTGQVRREFDTRRQRDNWLAGLPQQMRIEQTGSVIDSGAGTTKKATIDLSRIFWGGAPEDTRGSNLTLTMPFRAYLNTDTGQRVKYSFVNKIASMF